ncbi:MAG: DUF1559 domain-containing protein [Pirellulaceae bacterium]|nr:DUF1559 domain-containing protein [Planctomycetales bacterium]
MMATSFSEIVLVILAILGGVGIPLGTPPLPEDAKLMNLAPEKCLYYVYLAGTAEPDRQSKNSTEQLLADPEIKALVNDLIKRYDALSANMEQQEGLGKAGSVLGKLALVRPTALYVSNVDFQQVEREGVNVRMVDRTFTAEGALVIHVGEQRAEVMEVLRDVVKQMGNRAAKVEAKGTTFASLVAPDGRSHIQFGLHGEYLISTLTTTDDAKHLEALIDRMTTAPPAWLVEARKQVDVPRLSTFAYADMPAIMAPVQKMSGTDIDAFPILSELRTFVASTGLDGQRCRSRTLFQHSEGGWLESIGKQRLNTDLAKSIPSDSTVAVGAAIPGEQVYDGVFEILGKMNPEMTGFEQQMSGEMQNQFGWTFRDLLAAMGDQWAIYASPEDGGIATGWVLVTTVRDQKRLQEISDRFQGFVQQMHNSDSDPVVREIEFSGKKIYSFFVPDDDFVVTPSWYFDQDRAMISLFPQAIKGALRTDGTATGLADVPEAAEAIKGDGTPIVVGYVDTATILKVGYPALQVAAQVILGQMQGREFRNAPPAIREATEGLDPTLLPSLRALVRYVKPSTFSLRATPEGLRVESSRTLPGANVGAVAPVLTAAMLPAVDAARTAAMRNQAMTNERQIVLALLNYESAYQRFPPAYSVDKDGKPLLSWRVLILPFLEENGLYQEFHLDEPWDSPHNRKLIARMPQVYHSPVSHADPGKTSYLGIGGEKGMFCKPDEQGHGIRIAKITDGTSNTIAIAEVSDEMAAIWTQPVDYTPDPQEPIKGIPGLWPGRVMLMGFVDGHVSQIPADIDADTIYAGFTRNGGEPVRIP